jgi:hypothetical protein
MAGTVGDCGVFVECQLAPHDRSPRRKICPKATFRTTSPTWFTQGESAGLWDETSASNRPSYRTAENNN